MGISIYYNINEKIGEYFLNKGIVKRWLSDRRCGVISVDKLKKEILVKSSNLKGTIYLEQGEKVRFNIKETTRGLIAINVEPLNC